MLVFSLFAPYFWAYVVNKSIQYHSKCQKIISTIMQENILVHTQILIYILLSSASLLMAFSFSAEICHFLHVQLFL